MLWAAWGTSFEDRCNLAVTSYKLRNYSFFVMIVAVMIKRFDMPYMADWFAISLRWVLLIGFVVALGLGGRLDIQSSWPLGFMIVWNLFMAVLAALNVRMSFHRRISMVVDFALAGAFSIGCRTVCAVRHSGWVCFRS
jgi:hypothetical protein